MKMSYNIIHNKDSIACFTVRSLWNCRSNQHWLYAVICVVL